MGSYCGKNINETIPTQNATRGTVFTIVFVELDDGQIQDNPISTNFYQFEKFK